MLKEPAPPYLHLTGKIPYLTAGVWEDYKATIDLPHFHPLLFITKIRCAIFGKLAFRWIVADKYLHDSSYLFNKGEKSVVFLLVRLGFSKFKEANKKYGMKTEF